MSDRYHIVPWYDSEEWHRVYEDISNVSSNKEDALKRLLVWKARAPSLPSGIESTLSLLQVCVEDAKNSTNVSNDQVLRLAYSAAIMRFVNHMLDTQIVKGASLYRAAKTLGVPDWIVDLRHDTAHSNTLPPLALLREACTISLQWLQKNYWDKHKPYVKDYITGQKNISNRDANKITALINFCFSLSICAHSKLKIKNLSEIPNNAMRESIVNDAKELLGDHIDLSNLKTVSIMSLINIMNNNGKKLLKVKDVSIHVNKALLGDDSLFLSKDLLYFFSSSDFKRRNKLCISYVQCFEVLLTFLYTNELLLDFILALINVTQSQQSEHFKSQLAALWISEILVALKISQTFLNKVKKLKLQDKISRKRKDLKQLHKQWFPNNTGNNLILDLMQPVPEELQEINFIKPIMTKYNPYLTYYIRNLLDLLEPNLPALVTGRICALARVIASPETFPLTSSPKIYTADELQMTTDGVMIVKNDDDMDIEQKEEHNNSQEQLNNSVWRLASKEHNWSMCPIGKVPWQLIESDNFVEMETNQGH